MAKKVIGILQPGYLPWLGFFEQMLHADVFVLYDDVQYDKHGWRNRNRIKGPQGSVWLTVPVITKKQQKPKVNQVLVNPSQPKWPQKHLGTIRQYYAKAPYFEDYFPALQAVLLKPWQLLLELDLELINLLRSWLGIETEMVLASELDCPHPDPTGRLVAICRELGADVFYEGASGRDYMDLSQFQDVGIQVVFQEYQPRPYPQQYGEFVPFLSALDLVLNCGPVSSDYISGMKSALFT
ncbi:MAG: WbqC family protein [Desulfarculaceae bacterium]|jgi:hypothetical protein